MFESILGVSQYALAKFLFFILAFATFIWAAMGFNGIIRSIGLKKISHGSAIFQSLQFFFGVVLIASLFWLLKP